MRLINTETLTLKQFYDTDLPKYAILSHCWGDEEVSFSDLSRNVALEGAGLTKIRQSCRLAVNDGYEWIWIDTCCIDKSSSAELSEAINSMFRWYQNAEICYAYISDAKGDEPESFQHSRWFTRGWTLQELLAPRQVKFFDTDWKMIGDRDQVTGEIAAATGINFIDPFCGQSWTDGWTGICIAKKMSWVAKRETSRPEDIAYCLLGLFDINMPLLYGEGAMKAFRRLQLAILNTTDDESIFAWGPLKDTADTKDADHHPTEAKETPAGRLTGLLAPSPKHFAAMIQNEYHERSERAPWMMTNKGLQLTLGPGSWTTVKGVSSSECISVLFSAAVFEEDRWHRPVVFLVRDRESAPWSRLEQNPLSPYSSRSRSRILRAQIKCRRYTHYWPKWLEKFGKSKTIYVEV